MHVFDQALSLEPVSGVGQSSRFVADLDRAFWVADSGPWGGYLSALLTKAIGEAIPELPIVSLTVHFTRRLRTGPANVIIDAEARGARVAHVTGRVVQDGQAGAVAVATLGENPQPDFATDFARPDAPPPDRVRRRAESTHPYMQHLDIRPTVTVRPWSDDNEGTLAGWIRMETPRPLDLPLLAALPDAWMPGTWARLTTPSGKVTVDMTTHFRGTLRATDDGWWFIRVRTRHVERGFADEECEIWGSDGRFLSQSRQLVLLARRPS